MKRQQFLADEIISYITALREGQFQRVIYPTFHNLALLAYPKYYEIAFTLLCNSIYFFYSKKF